MTAPTTPTEPQATGECCPPPAGVLDEATTQQLAALAKVLGDPVRLRIYAHIAASQCSSVCACHLPEAFGISQPTLSHHLKKLVEAGLVERETRGRWAHFSVRPGGLELLRGFLHSLPE